MKHRVDPLVRLEALVNRASQLLLKARKICERENRDHVGDLGEDWDAMLDTRRSVQGALTFLGRALQPVQKDIDQAKGA